MKQIFLSFIVALPLLAGPESFDHLAAWKYPEAMIVPDKTNAKGPVSETVLVNGKEVASATYTYNAANRLTQATYSENGLNAGKSIFSYAEGKLVTEKIYDADNAVAETVLYDYDKSGKLVSYQVKAEGSADISWNFKYTAQGLVSGKKIEAKQSAESFIIERTNPNHILQQIFIPQSSHNELAGTIVFEYRDGRLAKRIRTLGETRSEIVYRYENDRLVKMEFYSSAGAEPLRLIKSHLLKY